MQQRGFLLILSGPSGAGKNTVLDAARERLPDLLYSGSATTRPRRPLEEDGLDYFFLTKEEFQRRVEAGSFWNGRSSVTIITAHPWLISLKL